MEKCNKFSGQSVDDWEKALPVDLESDAVGLWMLIPALKYDFGFEADELIEHVRKGIIIFLEHGALPVRCALKDDPGDWVVQKQYGTTPEEIADNVIAEWLAMQRDPHVGDLWFATEKFYGLR